MALLTERYADRSGGVLSCHDRIIITGTPPGVYYAQGKSDRTVPQGHRAGVPPPVLENAVEVSIA